MKLEKMRVKSRVKNKRRELMGHESLRQTAARGLCSSCHDLSDQAPAREALRPHPDILLLSNGEVGIQVYNFWRSVHGCGIPRDLKKTNKQTNISG